MRIGFDHYHKDLEKRIRDYLCKDAINEIKNFIEDENITYKPLRLNIDKIHKECDYLSHSNNWFIPEYILFTQDGYKTFPSYTECKKFINKHDGTLSIIGHRQDTVKACKLIFEKCIKEINDSTKEFILYTKIENSILFKDCFICVKAKITFLEKRNKCIIL